jgi:hypothetical protein
MIERMHSSRVHLRRPFLTPIWVAAGAASAAFLLALGLLWVWGTAGATTILVISEDAAGEERAAVLAHMLGAPGPGQLDAIYISSLPRAGRIASPLAERLKIAPRAAPETDAHALAQRALREHRGGRVLIIARPDLFAGVVEALSGIEEIPQRVAGDETVIYLVTVPRIGHANLLRLNY